MWDPDPTQIRRVQNAKMQILQNGSGSTDLGWVQDPLPSLFGGCARGCGRGYGQSGRNRGCEEGGGRGQYARSMSSIQCYYCKRYMVTKKTSVGIRDEQDGEQNNYALKVEEEESKLF